MGKHGKKQDDSRGNRHLRAHDDDDGGNGALDDGYDDLSSSDYDLPSSSDDDPEEEEEEAGEKESPVAQELEAEEGNVWDWLPNAPSKYHLYKLFVQAPKADISYIQNFFLLYVGCRFPLHLQQDFCGTALLSTQWIQSDSRRTAVGIDSDIGALYWCLDNNLSKIGADGYSRVSLFHGDVLQPQEAHLIQNDVEYLVKGLRFDESDTDPQQCGNNSIMRNLVLHDRDIICAFNNSCCCLHVREELVMYFKHALNALSKCGGIFVMDLYGGTLSECKLRIQRKFSNFTYIWEQQEFDILNHRTRINVHFHHEKQRTIQHAFSCDWRLWSLPEVKDCLEEAGFQSVHFWIDNMAETKDGGVMDGRVFREVKYEELSSFHHQDAWHAYIVGVANILEDMQYSPYPEFCDCDQELSKNFHSSMIPSTRFMECIYHVSRV